MEHIFYKLLPQVLHDFMQVSLTRPVAFEAHFRPWSTSAIIPPWIVFQFKLHKPFFAKTWQFGQIEMYLSGRLSMQEAEMPFVEAVNLESQ